MTNVVSTGFEFDYAVVDVGDNSTVVSTDVSIDAAAQIGCTLINGEWVAPTPAEEQP